MIITKENVCLFNEKKKLDDDVRGVGKVRKNLSEFEITRARKALGDRRRMAADRHRGQRDGTLHYKRVEKSYSAWSLSQATPSTYKIIQRGIDDYLDELESQIAEAEAHAEAEALD